MHELALITNNIMYDVNVEHFGWNRDPHETAMEYIKRVWNDDYLETVQNNAFHDMSFERCMDLNDVCLPIDSCYYFSYTTGLNQKFSNCKPAPETAQDVKTFTNDIIGFDLQKVSDLKWQDIARPQGESTIFGKVSTLFKQLSDPIFTFADYYIRWHKFDVPELFESQRDSTNWDALKWDDDRWHDDSDTLVTRVAQEFPRISHKFTKLSADEKPWGTKVPRQFNWEDNTKLTKFEKGRWFYTALENSSHLDYCGWPALAIIKHLREFFGVENRYEFSKQFFERLYSLEF